MQSIISILIGRGYTKIVILRICSKVIALILFVSSLGLAVTPLEAQQDITPPALLAVHFEPAQIDTGNGPATITVTVHVTDDLSGVEWIAFSFRKPDTTQTKGIDIVPGTNWGKLLEGDSLNGKYQNTMTLPQYSAYGTWELYYFALVDNVGNRVDVWKPENKEEAERGTKDWPALYNSFVFVVGETESPQQPQRRLFIPSVAAE